jgi:hypothetical protein
MQEHASPPVPYRQIRALYTGHALAVWTGAQTYRSFCVGRTRAMTKDAGHQVEGGGRGLPGATVRAKIPSVARSALSGITGKMAASFQAWSAPDQS